MPVEMSTRIGKTERLLGAGKIAKYLNTRNPAAFSRSKTALAGSAFIGWACKYYHGRQIERKEKK